MKKSTRLELAKEIVEITGRGSYVAPSGREVAIGAEVEACLGATRFVSADEVARIRDEVLATPAPDRNAVIEVAGETTLGGIARLRAEHAAPIAALNFASARSPGGGFLNGAEAQEESIARSSALYPSLLRARDFYDLHRAQTSLLYTDAMILSPACPVLRDDRGVLLEAPVLASFITSAAPNAGAAADNRPDEVPLVSETLARRAELVLALAASSGHQLLVLGAWGCGVFRNDPRVVASVFAEHLRPGGAWNGRFERVVFSIFDGSPAKETLRAFEAELTFG